MKAAGRLARSTNKLQGVRNMSANEGTNATTGTVQPSKRQLVASDSQLVKLLVKQNVAAEKIRDAVMTKIDEVISNGAWRVSFNADGQPFNDVKEYLTDRLAPVATLAALIAIPVADRLLSLTNDKEKSLFTIREVSELTNVSRGKLDSLNEAAGRKTKRAARPNDGSDETDDNGQPLSDERKAAVKAVKRVPGTVSAVLDTMADMTADERVSVASQVMSLVGKLVEQHKVSGNGDLVAAVKVAREAADKAADKSA
jgi:hypothetical protein